MTPRGEPITFWFDFASGYAYFAALDIEALAARVGREVLWRPFILGTAFKVTGARGLSSTPLKKDYAHRDWQRIARQRGVAFRLPAHHPSVALAGPRAFYALEARDPLLARAFARALLDAYFTRGIDTGDVGQVTEVAATLGVDAQALAREVAEPEVKEQVKRLSQAAVEAGVFGSPFFQVDGEPFWGWDRMAMMEAWIEHGGW